MRLADTVGLTDPAAVGAILKRVVENIPTRGRWSPLPVACALQSRILVALALVVILCALHLREPPCEETEPRAQDEPGAKARYPVSPVEEDTGSDAS
jgi:hypothetical protein